MASIESPRANGSAGKARSIISAGSRAGRGAGRGPLGAEGGGVAVAHRDGLVQQGHRRVGLARRLGGRHARAGLTGQARQRGVAAGGLEPLLARPRRQPVEQRQRPPGVGRGAGGVAQGAAGQAAVEVALGQVAAVPRDSGSSLTSASRIATARSQGSRASAGRPRRRSTTERSLSASPRHRDSRDLRVVVGQLLADRQRLAVLGLRLRRLARLRQQAAEVVVAVRQAAAEFGDGGVVVGQLLVDRQRLAVLGLRLRRLARLRQQDAEVVVAVRQAAAESVTAGLSSASFWWIASALRYSASASAGLPVCRQQDAEVVVAVRQVGCGTR